MLELLERFQHWFFTPNYEQEIKRHLAQSRLHHREELANAHYSSLMAQFYAESIKRDEKALQGLSPGQTTVIPNRPTGSFLKEELL